MQALTQLGLANTSDYNIFFFSSPILLCQILTIWAGIFHTRYLSQGTLFFLESSSEVSSAASKTEVWKNMSSFS